MSRYRLPYSQPPPASTISSRRTPSPISRRSAFSSSKPPAGARSGARRSSPQRPDGPMPDPAHAGNPATLTTLAPPQAGEGNAKRTTLWAMRDVMTEVKAWLANGDPVAVATVISTWGSAPRPAGSRMAISQSGEIAGSVSGGCLEGEVFEQAQAILKGKPASLFHYGARRDRASTAGLRCCGAVARARAPAALG